MGVLGAIAAAVKGVKVAIMARIAETNTTTPWYQIPINISGLSVPLWILLVVVLCGGLAIGYFLSKRGSLGKIERY